LAQNNSIFNLIYTYSDGPLTISPYLQYSRVDGDRSVGIDQSAETYGAAILARYKFGDNFSLADASNTSGRAAAIAPRIRAARRPICFMDPAAARGRSR